MTRKGSFIDLFAGCGGLSLGLTNSGWQGALAIEKDAMAFETLRSNLVDGPSKTRYSWVPGIPKKALGVQSLLTTYERQLRSLSGRVDLIAGGPPCQGFSSAGKRNGSDPRNQMLLHYVRIVSIVQPKFILLENVRGIAALHKASEEPYADLLLRKLRAAGYVCVTRIVRASECGVAQERPRFIVLGVRQSAVPSVELDSMLGELWEAAIHAGRKQLFRRLNITARHVTVREALSDLECQGRPLEQCPDAPGREQLVYSKPRTAYQKLLHGDVTAMDSMRLARHSDRTVERFAWLQSQCAPGTKASKYELGAFNTKKHTQVVLDARKPSRTLTTLPDDLVHYSEPRILSVREYARLQSFPDWFKFTGKYTTGGDRRTKECPRYTQVGNAVAPFVAEVLGYAIADLAATLAKRNVRIVTKPLKRHVSMRIQPRSSSGGRIRRWGTARR